MFGKSSQFAFASRFAIAAVAALALGGCAAAEGNEHAKTPAAALAYVAAPTVVDAKPMAKLDLPAAQPDARQASAASPPSASHRREDCGR
jgi:hypothetical protein